MRTVRSIELISLDGVIQAPGGPEEDRENGFDHGGWAIPSHFDGAGATIAQAQGRGFDPGLGVDIVAGIAAAKAGAGSDLVVRGSSTRTPPLIAEGLADEVLRMVFPVMIGRGKRISLDLARPGELRLTQSKATSSGVIPSTYKPAGAMRIGSF